MNENKIVKPLTVAREDFLNTVVEACNNSGLPFFVIEEVLRMVIQNISKMAMQQFKADKARFENELNQKDKIEKGRNEQ